MYARENIFETTGWALQDKRYLHRVYQIWYILETTGWTLQDKRCIHLDYRQDSTGQALPTPRLQAGLYRTSVAYIESVRSSTNLRLRAGRYTTSAAYPESSRSGSWTSIGMNWYSTGAQKSTAADGWLFLSLISDSAVGGGIPAGGTSWLLLNEHWENMWSWLVPWQEEVTNYQRYDSDIRVQSAEYMWS